MLERGGGLSRLKARRTELMERKKMTKQEEGAGTIEIT